MALPATQPPYPFDLLLDLAQELDLEAKEVGELLGIHPRTLLRRRESGELDEAEGLKAQMLHEVATLAATALGGPEAARIWLFAELPALDFQRPVDVLRTIRGYERVKTLLGQIAFGIP